MSRPTPRARPVQTSLRLLPVVEDYPRPKTRQDCPEERPCAFVGCRHHLLFEVSASTGELRWNANLEQENSCSLDLADEGDRTLEEVGEVLGMTRERVRQIEQGALEKLRAVAEHGVFAHPETPPSVISHEHDPEPEVEEDAWLAMAWRAYESRTGLVEVTASAEAVIAAFHEMPGASYAAIGKRAGMVRRTEMRLRLATYRVLHRAGLVGEFARGEFAKTEPVSETRLIAAAKQAEKVEETG